ncbi:MAG TPA: lytic transglycosylase domain-containing protein [Acetobacteraceae bacterium]
MRGFFLLGLLLAGTFGPALADSGPLGASGRLLCPQAIAGAEQAHAIPPRLLAAIGRVESGRADSSGVVVPWPWTINAEGQGRFFDSKAEAVAAVRALQAQGVQSIDVGCMQVNLMHHPDAFASLDQAFDPVANADYAAGFLRRLYVQTSNWADAAAQYHSATPGLADDYRRKVMMAWGGGADGAPPSAGWNPSITPPFAIVRPGGLSPHIAQAGAAAPAGVGGFAARGRGLEFYRARPIAIAIAGMRG